MDDLSMFQVNKASVFKVVVLALISLLGIGCYVAALVLAIKNFGWPAFYIITLLGISEGIERGLKKSEEKKRQRLAILEARFGGDL